MHLLVLFRMMDSVGDPEVPGEMAATTRVPTVHCVGWDCYAEGSYLTMDHLFELLKQHNDKEVELAMCEWL
jgi:hypothetical protein